MNLDNFLTILLALINNAFIMLSLVFFYTATNFDIQTKSKTHIIVSGFMIGVASILIMNQPFSFSQGLFIDSRFILFALSANFFGFMPTVIGAVIAIFYRLSLDGLGVYIGVIGIIINVFIGTIWTVFKTNIKFKNIYVEYYVFGLITQFLTMVLFISLPEAVSIIGPLFIAYVVLYPLVLMLIAVIIEKQKEKKLINEEINHEKTILKKAIDSSDSIEIFTLDTNHAYLTYNNFHVKQMRKFNNYEISKGVIFTDIISNEYIRQIMDKKIEEVLKMKTVSTILNLGDHFYEYTLSPLLDKSNIIGITCYARDVSEQKKYEDKIIEQSFQDALTLLYNRRFFNIKKENLNFFDEVSFIMCDVNGLKVINDAFGHDKGDEALKQFASILKEVFGKHGFVFRMGGDEFSVIIPNKDKKHATKLMEKVIEKIDIKISKNLKLSVAYGIATSNHTISVDEAIKLAEEQMYKQKLFESHSYRSKFIETIIQSLYEKNPKVESHSVRVSNICLEIGKKLNMTKYELKLLEVISVLHDIGKIAIDEAIINKPGKLNDEEWNKIKRHPEIGYRIISSSPEYNEIAYDILSHHERYDGEGYPQGLKGEDIPLRARIIAIADSFDAMTSKRSYRKAMTVKQAVSEIKKCSGTQFDPKLVDIFLEIVNEGYFNNYKAE